MDIVTTIAERKIREALERGDLDNLAGKGKPLPREDLSGVPDELRMGYKVLKNAGMLPPELELNREILSLKDLLDCCRDEQERRQVKKRLTEKTLRFNILMEKNFNRPAFRQYEEKIRNKIGV
ncbi:MAG: DUF1992 domain-containing protein [Desulfuromonadales bacterium]|nr:DUF1992 domain-containing protein [Desulfuromonadales bacterium]NIR33201.1 DUF1992 domain-containing protein [Desulfuromonadales bacterium]NIS41987.1 DUF1992 domain-containing protein [Desulfuromonadales bacterium]